MESNESGFTTKCGSFSAVPFGETQFIIIHNGYQIRCCKNLVTAKNFINSEIKKLK